MSSMRILSRPVSRRNSVRLISHKHSTRSFSFKCLSSTRPGCGARRVDSPLARKQRFYSTPSLENGLPDYYKILELTPNSTAAQIKTSYYSLSKRYHPDTGGTQDDAVKLQEVQAAWHTLRDPSKRRDYDLKRINQGYDRPAQSTRTRLRKERAYNPAAAPRPHHRPLEMGFTPRSSWDPLFREFFDDWTAKMKEQGLDPTRMGQTRDGKTPTPQLLQEMMDGDILSQYMKKMRAQGKDPLSTVFLSHAGRGSSAAQWLKNRMAVLDREAGLKSGGVWERGSGKHAGTSFGSQRPAYSSDDAAGASSAEKLGGRGTGEETFNSPWDEAPRRGFQKEYPRPWWASGAPNGEPHIFDSWSASGVDGRPVKRDYSKGHTLDARYEDDKLRMVADEKRLMWFGLSLVATVAAIAGGAALST
ncbi:DnaJ-domain-containing protein [Serendipita vermifera]|nr:DnaJ-domain-containing protein [Serendipita vermifera]